MKKIGEGPRKILWQAGFEQSNPWLVTTYSIEKIPYLYHQNKPEHTAGFQAVYSGFCCSDWRSQKISKSYAPKYLDGKRIQTVDTYYSAVGILDELTPEEMEEVFQKSLAERKKTETA